MPKSHKLTIIECYFIPGLLSEAYCACKVLIFPRTGQLYVTSKVLEAHDKHIIAILEHTWVDQFYYTTS